MPSNQHDLPCGVSHQGTFGGEIQRFALCVKLKTPVVSPGQQVHAWIHARVERVEELRSQKTRGVKATG